MDKQDELNGIIRQNLSNSEPLLDSINESLQITMESINSSVTTLIEDLSSQMVSLLKTLDTALKPYEKFGGVKNFQNTLNQVLNKYQWFVFPEMPMPFVFELMECSLTDNPRKEINKLYFDFFAYNDFENLKDLVRKWELSGKFRQGRMRIIRDCLNAIVNAENNKIPSTLIVPTLIAQIDGIQREFLIKNDFKLLNTRFKFKGEGKQMNQKEAWNHIYNPNDMFSSITNDIVLDVLFANSLPGEPIKTPITFNRHKIMHGEHLNYGTIPNTLRTFLILDFLHSLL